MEASVDGVLARGKWWAAEDRHLRARLMEERGMRLEAEATQREEGKRVRYVEEVRAEIMEMGYEEYVPAAEASIEKAKQARAYARRKQELEGRSPRQLEWLAKTIDDLNARRLEREERKRLEWEAFWEDVDKRQSDLAEFEAGGIRF